MLATWRRELGALKPALLLAVALLPLEKSALAGAAPVDVPLSWEGHFGKRGLCTAQLQVGTPPQSVTVSIDSGSGLLWVPSGQNGYNSNRSSTGSKGAQIALKPYADGFQVNGDAFHDVISIGSAGIKLAPVIVATTTSGGQAREDGILGLGCPSKNPDEDGVESFFCQFWQENPDLPQTFRLEIGREAPRMLIGDAFQEGDRAAGNVRIVANGFTARTSLWYASVRAMGASKPGSPSSAGWSADFNTVFPNGAAALLDSGAAAIRVSSSVFTALLHSMPSGCEASSSGAGITCPCDNVDAFPTLSFSFEAASNIRFLGVDAGADFIACVPPSAYVFRLAAAVGSAAGASGQCSLAILDAGRSHQMFGVEAIVLGVPFFKSVAVAYDVVQRRLGIGAGSDIAAAHCFDPKNMWSTGRRISWLRCSTVLAITVGLFAYLFIMHSSHSLAEWLRNLRQPTARGARLGGGGARAESSLLAGTEFTTLPAS